MIENILLHIGKFSDKEIALFEKMVTHHSVNKNEYLLREGEICKSVYYIKHGAFFQFKENNATQHIIDLHLQKEWMFNNRSLTQQSPSQTSIKAFTNSEVIVLDLSTLHYLISQSQSFLQFGRIFNQSDNRVQLFDNSLNPQQKYDYIKTVKPAITLTFPLKMVASYLKITPETLSRVRANY